MATASQRIFGKASRVCNDHTTTRPAFRNCMRAEIKRLRKEHGLQGLRKRRCKYGKVKVGSRKGMCRKTKRRR